ncbi:MAG: SRPBCC family protein [Chloroflexi bacterium]|nr:SRPBCC family protein [Chloroflexota bacterium]
MQISERIEIDAPRERVFEVFCDIPHAAEMLDGIEQIEVLGDERFDIGFRWRETRTMFGKQATEEMWVTMFERPASFEVEAASHGTHYLSVYRFEPLGDQRTAVTLNFTGRPVALASKLISPLAILFKRSSAKAFRADLEQLKAVCEKPV